MTVQKPKQYVIRSFDDIYQLPTDEMIKRCLRLMAVDMIVMRQTVALIEAGAVQIACRDKAKPKAPKLRTTWPNEFIWIDDGRDVSALTLEIDEKPVLEIQVRHKGKRKRP